MSKWVPPWHRRGTSAASTGSAATSEPSDEALQAVALDTNCMPHGSFSLKLLDSLIDARDAKELDFEIWIPEPIVWEWAEHLHRGIQSARNAHITAQKTARSAGLSLDDTTSDEADLTIDSVISSLKAAIKKRPNTSVLELSSNPSAASLGLRDQVLQIGAGALKGGVKSGAADSTSFRLIEANARRADGDVFIVSADKDALRYFADRKGFIVLRDLRAAKVAISNLPSQDELDDSRFEAQLRLVSTYITDQQWYLDEDTYNTARVEDAEPIFRSLLESANQMEYRISLDSITEVSELTSISLDRSADFATAEATAVVALQLSSWWWNDREERAEYDFDLTYDVAAKLLLTLTTSDEGKTWNPVVDGVVALPLP